ncbi:MAG: GIY-YIG nuclease family protein [Patescibacteria group bacterium]
MYYIYIIKSLISSRYYVGSTTSTATRLKRHNKGGNKSTKWGAP